jgi:hypothetical protein
MTECPLFSGPVGDVHLEYVIRREREQDYLAKLSNLAAGRWTTGLGRTPNEAVVNAYSHPLRCGTIGQDADDTTAEGQGPDATTAGVPA